MPFNAGDYGTVYLEIDCSIEANVLDSGGAAASDGENVDKVVDNSGNSRNLRQTTDSRRPVFRTNTLNGFSVIEFSGSGDWATLENSVTLAKNVSGVTAVFVYKMLGSDTQGGLLQVEDNSFGDRLLCYYESTWAMGMQRADGAGADYRESGNADAGDTWYIRIDTANYSAREADIWINGVNKLAATAVSSAGTTSNTNSSSAPVVGAGSSGGAYDAHIQLAHLIVYQSVLSDVTIGNLNTALDSKWINPPTGNTSTGSAAAALALATYTGSTVVSGDKTITLPTPVPINLTPYNGLTVATSASAAVYRKQPTKQKLSILKRG